ncbi:MAG: hypothetical protein KBS58_03600, partial [Bacteroidales bacterium]|nr:hypothetical protein [Candidatus Cacconaster equi]
STQNLAITDSGNKKWKGGNTDAVTVPGTIYPTVVGDYFQWGAYAGYCGNESGTDKGLLIYNSFTNTKCVDDTGTDGFVFKTNDDKPYIFNKDDVGETVGISPYYDKTQSPKKYIKYNTTEENKLKNTDDAARIILGDTWRMPTEAELGALIGATYWAWDDNAKGYYVFLPGMGTNGQHNTKGTITSTDIKADALLFFPATGSTSNENLQFPGQAGYYWSSVLYPGTTDSSPAYSLMFYLSTQLKYNNKTSRYAGCSIRPVKDVPTTE